MSVNISYACQHPPVHSVDTVMTKVESMTSAIRKLQEIECVAACNRYFPQGYEAAKNANLIMVINQPEGIIAHNHNGDFIFFCGIVESIMDFPNGYSRHEFNNRLSFKFKAFDGLTSRDEIAQKDKDNKRKTW